MKNFAFLGTVIASAILTHFGFPAGDNKTIPQASDAVEPRPIRPKMPKGPPADQVQVLITQHENAMVAFRKLYEATGSDEEKEKLISLFPDPEPYAALLVQIAERSPGDAAAVDALMWAARNGNSEKAKGILIRDYLLHPKIGPLCLDFRDEPGNSRALRIVRRVLADNPSKEAQAHAAVALAMILKSNASLARNIQKAAPRDLATWEKRIGQEALTFLKTADVAVQEKEAEALLERATKEKIYADVTISFGDGRIHLGDLAGRELFQMRHLQPGKKAPEIVGEDINGKPMKLSDFSGKVVMLDFWGYW